MGGETLQRKPSRLIIVLIAGIVTTGFIPIGGAFEATGEDEDRIMADSAEERFHEKGLDRMDRVDRLPTEERLEDRDGESVLEERFGQRVSDWMDRAERPTIHEAELPGADVTGSDADSMTASTGIVDVKQEDDCEPHPPIRITEEQGSEGFTLANSGTGEIVPRPGSGVTQGSGTADDPYVIEGWCILPTEREAQFFAASLWMQPWGEGILLEDTSSHVVLRNNVIIGYEVGIELDSTENVVIEDSTITNSGSIGVNLESGSENVVQANTIANNNGVGVYTGGFANVVQGNTIANNGGVGVHAGGFENVVEENTIADNDSIGVSLASGSKNMVEGNTITNNEGTGVLVENMENVIRGNTIMHNAGDGVGVSWASKNVVEGNMIANNGWFGVFVEGFWNVVEENTIDHHMEGIAIWGSDNAVLNNSITDNLDVGVFLSGSHGNLLEGNTINHNGGDGVLLLGNSQDNTISENIIAHNDQNGILLVDISFDRVPSGTVIGYNNIHANTDSGLSVEAHKDTLQATGNWWGHATGPSGGTHDACTDTLADGKGDMIYIEDDVNVCFDPWLEEPHAGAM